MTMLHKNIWHRVKPALSELSPWTGKNLVGVDGTAIRVLGSVRLPLKLNEVIFSADIVVADGLTTDGILGLDFLESNNCTINTVQLPMSQYLWLAPVNCLLPSVRLCWQRQYPFHP